MRIRNTGESHKEVTKQKKSIVSYYYFCLMIEGSGAGPGAASGAGSVLVTNGSRCWSGGSKNIRILRIRIPNTCPHTEIYMYHNRGNPSHFSLEPSTSATVLLHYCIFCNNCFTKPCFSNSTSGLYSIMIFFHLWPMRKKEWNNFSYFLNNIGFLTKENLHL